MKLPIPSFAGVAGFLAANLYDNPVVTKEFRTRMRGWKAFLVMGGYVGFLAVVALITYVSYSAIWSYQSGGSGLANQRVGLHLFGSMTWTQTILLILVIPALAARSLTGELEQKTMELLVLTRLSPGRIVLGKLLSGLLYSMILLMCSLPIAGMCIMFGGISPGEVARAYALLMGWAFLLTSVSVYWSSVFAKTMAATMFGYGSGGLFTLFASSLIGSMYMLFHGGGTGNIPVFTSLIPGWAVYFGGRDAVVCGLHISTAGIAFGFQVALGTLLLLVASTRVKYKSADRPLSIRLLLVGLTAAVYWLLLGDKSLLWASYPSTSDLRDTMVFAILSALILLGISAPVFATGPIRKKQGDSLLRYAISVRKAFSSDLGGGMPFMLLWAGVLCAVVLITMAWAASAYGLPAPASVHTAKSAQIPFMSLALLPWIRMTIVTLAVVAGISALGLFASSVASRRQEAVAMMVVVLLLFFGLYGGVVASHQIGHSNPDNPVWQFAALWPITPFLAQSGEWGTDMPPLLWNPKQSWMIVSGMYILLGVAAVSGAGRMLRKRPGVQEE